MRKICLTGMTKVGNRILFKRNGVGSFFGLETRRFHDEMITRFTWIENIHRVNDHQNCGS